MKEQKKVALIRKNLVSAESTLDVQSKAVLKVTDFLASFRSLNVEILMFSGLEVWQS
jgi:BarA-like signal transduction histidine kinase